MAADVASIIIVVFVIIAGLILVCLLFFRCYDRWVMNQIKQHNRSPSTFLCSPHTRFGKFFVGYQNKDKNAKGDVEMGELRKYYPPAWHISVGNSEAGSSSDESLDMLKSPGESAKVKFERMGKNKEFWRKRDAERKEREKGGVDTLPKVYDPYAPRDKRWG